MGDPIKLKAFMRVSLPSGGHYDENRKVSIAIRDENHVQFFDAEIDMVDFTQMTLGNMEGAVEVELRFLEVLGCKREGMTVFIPKLDDPEYTYSKRDPAADKAVSAVESELGEGWKGYRGDYGNQHKSAKVDGVDGYQVHFTRFIRPDGTPVL